MAFLSGQPSLCAADQPLLVERLELLELCRRPQPFISDIQRRSEMRKKKVLLI